MPIYVQMKDGVAFAYVDTENPIENSIMLAQGVNPDNILAHSYIDGKWEPAPLIYFVEKFSEDGAIARISSTVFSSDITGEIIPEHVKVGWKKEGGEWIDPIQIEEQQRAIKQKEIEDAIAEVISTRPYPSWVWLNGEWVAPIDMPPGEPNDYYWDEESQSWQSFIDSEEPNLEIQS